MMTAVLNDDINLQSAATAYILLMIGRNNYNFVGFVASSSLSYFIVFFFSRRGDGGRGRVHLHNGLLLHGVLKVTKQFLLAIVEFIPLFASISTL